jgi:hypothetical protein
VPRKVDSVVLAFGISNGKDVSGARKKVLAKRVEKYRHNTIRSIESLVYSIALMNVDINVQDRLVLLWEFRNREHTASAFLV